MAIDPISASITHKAPLSKVESSSQTGEDFGKTLMDVLKDVNASQQDSIAKQNAFMTGQPIDVHDVMIAMERASMTLQLTMQVRNKLLEAYQEVMRMQV